jgi:membrane-associated phospholipid phosphatase
MVMATSSPPDRAAHLRRLGRALGPDGTLAVGAIGALAVIAAALGGALKIPWDGIVPFLGIAALLLAVRAVADLATAYPPSRERVPWPWPFAVVYLCYRALRGALPVLVDGGVEATLVRADVWLFGVSPAWSLEVIHARWLTELLALAYATMFLLPLAVLLVLHARGRARELRHVALALQVAFYVGFAGFLLVPARSPDVVYAFARPLEGYAFYEASMAAWRQLQAITYDAFPSMHTAISTLALVYAFRFGRLLVPRTPRLPGLVMLPIVALLQLATLYLRQHYFVDVVAGWAVAAIAVAGAGALERAWGSRRT